MKLFSSRNAASRSKSKHKAAHMTFAKTAFGRSFSQTRMILRRQLWLWPIIAFVVLSSVGFWIRSSIERTMKANLHEQLTSLLRVETAMLEKWYEIQLSNADLIANDPGVRTSITPLLEKQNAVIDPTSEEVRTANANLLIQLRPALEAHEYHDYFVVDRDHRIVAAANPLMLGVKVVPQYEPFVKKALAGETNVSTPFGSVLVLKDSNGVERSGVPTMFVAAPLRDANFHPLGLLALRIDPERDFTQILQLGQLGASGETYAINREGLFLSNSRFDEELILDGFLPDQPNSKSILQLQARDPGGDMTKGFRPKVRRSELPLTKMAAEVTQGQSGIDVEGYNDYRGVPVVGAWRWLSKYEIGVATEMDAAEAFAPLNILQRAFWTLYSLLVLASLASSSLRCLFPSCVARLRRRRSNLKSLASTAWKTS